MSKVFVLDTLKQPLTPVHPGRACLLLKAGKAAVYRRYPFTLILKRQTEQPVPALLQLSYAVLNYASSGRATSKQTALSSWPMTCKSARYFVRVASVVG